MIWCNVLPGHKTLKSSAVLLHHWVWVEILTQKCYQVKLECDEANHCAGFKVATSSWTGPGAVHDIMNCYYSTTQWLDAHASLYIIPMQGACVRTVTGWEFMILCTATGVLWSWRHSPFNSNGTLKWLIQPRSNIGSCSSQYMYMPSSTLLKIILTTAILPVSMYSYRCEEQINTLLNVRKLNCLYIWSMQQWTSCTN